MRRVVLQLTELFASVKERLEKEKVETRGLQALLPSPHSLVRLVGIPARGVV
jgi:hypothetical protein